MASNNDIDESMLPPILRHVVSALGVAKAQEFLKNHGGVNVVIPKKSSKSLGLSNEELAKLRASLSDHLDANGRIWMPKEDKILMQFRNSAIAKSRGTLSIRQLAKQYNLSSRQIQNISSMAADDDRQSDIFS